MQIIAIIERLHFKDKTINKIIKKPNIIDWVLKGKTKGNGKTIEERRRWEMENVQNV